MRRSLLVALLPLVGLGVAPASVTASASCAAPYVVDPDRLVLERGAEVSVEGRAFSEGCRDTMSCTGVPGCESCEYDEPPPEPMTDLDLVLRQDGRTWHLGQADAGSAEDGRLGWVTWEVELPRDVQPGPATLHPENGEPAGVLVR